MRRFILVVFSVLSLFILVSLSYSPLFAEEPSINKNSPNLNNYIALENTIPVLNFYFENFLLYLENIGDETAYNITISIHINGFIIYGDEDEEDVYGDTTLEPGERRAIIYFPLVFGFGPIKIIYTAEATNAEPKSFTLRAFLIGPYPWLLRV